MGGDLGTFFGLVDRHSRANEKRLLFAFDDTYTLVFGAK